MKTESNTQMPLVTKEVGTYLICFNEQKDGDMYSYDTLRVPKQIKYSDLVSTLRYNGCADAEVVACNVLGIEVSIDIIKEAKISAIIAYDLSENVNEFTLSGNKMWLPLEERKSMRQSLIALKARGIETFTYWLGLTPITMPVAQFETIMDEVEVYALQCFNVTAQHKAQVMALTTIEEVNAYDHTAEYPAKLEF